jgi:hypothetical protein
MNIKSIRYRQYEVSSQLIENTQSTRSRISKWLSNRWKAFLYTLSASHEPRVWQERDRTGQIWWRGYDSYTGQMVYCSTEAEMRAWLEQLPYMTANR